MDELELSVLKISDGAGKQTFQLGIAPRQGLFDLFEGTLGRETMRNLPPGLAEDIRTMDQGQEPSSYEAFLRGTLPLTLDLSGKGYGSKTQFTLNGGGSYDDVWLDLYADGKRVAHRAGIVPQRGNQISWGDWKIL